MGRYIYDEDFEDAIKCMSKQVKELKQELANFASDEYINAFKFDIKNKRLAIQALREKQKRENPQPLTLEELKQMEGCPVYMVVINNWCPECSIKEWVLIVKENKDNKEIVDTDKLLCITINKQLEDLAYTDLIDNYICDGAKFYRYKPKEEKDG